MSLCALAQYLMSRHNDPVVADHFSQIYQDMHRPMSHYFINSSHNTYLTGHQLQSKSTIDIYRQVLLAGCRCIEIDIWDGTSGEPEVTHGMTLCTRVPFDKVIQAVADCAFVNSPYPLILRLGKGTKSGREWERGGEVEGRRPKR